MKVTKVRGVREGNDVISAILFLLQMIILAVTDGPALIRRLRDPAEREIRWRTFFWIITIGWLVYTAAIESETWGVVGVGMLMVMLAYTVWINNRDEQPAWVKKIVWLVVTGLLLCGLCAWGMTAAVYLGWEPT